MSTKINKQLSLLNKDFKANLDTLNVAIFLFLFYFYFILDIDVDSKMSAPEFVSDTLQATTQDLVEVQEGMKKLGLGVKNGKI